MVFFVCEWINEMVSLFCFTADGNLYQYQYKAAANVAKPSHDPSETFMITNDVYSVSVSPYRGSARFPNCPKCSVTHLRWSYSAASSRYMQITTTNKGGYHAQHYPACNWLKVRSILNFGLRQKETSTIIEISQGALCLKSYTVFVKGAVSPRATGASTEDDHIPRKPCLTPYRGAKEFLPSVQDQGGTDPVNWTPCLGPYNGRTFSSNWITLKLSRLMFQIDRPKNWNHQHWSQASIIHLFRRFLWRPYIGIDIYF